MRIRIMISILLLILATGCVSPTPNISTQTYTTMPGGTLTRIITVTFTPTSSPSLTPLPILTSTSSAIPTWTPLPTLEPTTASTFVIDLLQDNAGCQLPCWWGLTPGQTTWAEVQQYLESFTYSYGIQGDPNDYQVAEFKIPLPKDIGADPYAFGFKDGILQDIFNIYYGNLTTSYNLVEMLNMYGQPDDVSISAYYESIYSDYMAVVAVFYLQKGILVRYYDDDGGIIGDKIQKCPQKAAYPHLTLWSPALNFSLDEVSSRFLDTRNWPPYRTLQDSTGMNISSFYQTFKDVNNNSCLELNTIDWPKF